MKRSTGLTLLVLGAVIIGVMALLVREAARGPQFRAADYGTYEECLRNIPREWLPGSLERTRAENACRYQHERRQQQGGG